MKYESRRLVPRVLEVGADVRVRVVDCRDARRSRQRSDLLHERMLPDRPRRCGRDGIGAERQLGVHACLLVVRGDEDAEVDAEREQEPEHEQPAVDRAAASARAGEQEAEGRRRPLAGGPRGDPGQSTSAQPYQQERGADPEQRGRQEHVDGERQRRIRVRVDDR